MDNAHFAHMEAFGYGENSFLLFKAPTLSERVKSFSTPIAGCEAKILTMS
ncbi:hypothetical protein SpAn4DRAFT_3199 [Sporomusa ovata]|uniref:Uncharacterized protein n=1 Tax=Sporomusa ovata TaxID=2378 RepID=A0A0U1L079_9FIRM|nr:hypothetical protein SpAn4DRAFT_3199 [Sporomusa ovata]